MTTSVSRWTHPFLAAAIAALVGGCVVGDPLDGPGTDPPDNTPDAGAAQLGQWEPVTSGLIASPFIHFVSEQQIYTIDAANRQVKMWNGTSWVGVTGPIPGNLGISPYFHYVSDNEIYVLYETAAGEAMISMWDGAAVPPAFVDITQPQTGLQLADFHFVGPQEIYAFVNEGICMWNAQNQWDCAPPAGTDTQLGIMNTGGFHWLSQTDIYAMVGLQIFHWDGLAWGSHTLADQPGLAADMQFLAPNNIYSVIGQQICNWDGTQWNPITENAPATIGPSFAMQGTNTFYTVGGDGNVERFVLP